MTILVKVFMRRKHVQPSESRRKIRGGFSTKHTKQIRLLEVSQSYRTFFLLFFDWFSPFASHASQFLSEITLGVFWIRPLVGARRCRSRMKVGLDNLPSKN